MKLKGLITDIIIVAILVEGSRGLARIFVKNITAEQERFFSFWGTLIMMFASLIFITIVYHTANALWPLPAYGTKESVMHALSGEGGTATKVIEFFYYAWIIMTFVGLVVGNSYAAAHPPKAD